MSTLLTKEQWSQWERRKVHSFIPNVAERTKTCVLLIGVIMVGVQPFNSRNTHYSEHPAPLFENNFKKDTSSQHRETKQVFPLLQSCTCLFFMYIKKIELSYHTLFCFVSLWQQQVGISEAILLKITWRRTFPILTNNGLTRLVDDELVTPSFVSAFANRAEKWNPGMFSIENIAL